MSKRIMVYSMLFSLLILTACGKANDGISKEEYDAAVSQLSALKQEAANKSDEDNPSTEAADSSVVTVDLTDSYEIKEDDNASDLMKAFNISSSNSADYINATNGYGYFNGGGKFSFYYPYKLFNHIEKSDYVGGVNTDEATLYIFSGDNGSSLTCVEMKYSDGAESINAYLQEYVNGIYEATTISELEDEDGKCVAYTGYEDESKEMIIYCLIRVDSNCAYVMDARFPKFADEADEIRKNYYAECIYRGAGFSITKKELRTYDDYCASRDFGDEIYFSVKETGDVADSILTPYVVNNDDMGVQELKYTELDAARMAKNYMASRGLVDFDAMDGGAGDYIYSYEAYNENETDSMHPVIFAARGEIDLRTGKGTGYLYYIDDEDQDVDYTEFDY